MNAEKAKIQLEPMMTIAAGRITCSRCQATSKRTKRQCGAPASKGKRVCRFHGGRSTGPKTEDGRKRCASAKTLHGRETRSIREQRKWRMAELKVLELIIKRWGKESFHRTRRTG